MRCVKLLALVLSLIMMLTVTACETSDGAETSGSENSSVSSSEPEDNTPEPPIPEKSAEEVFEMVKSYFDPESDLNYKISYTNKSISDGVETVYTSAESITIKNNGKDGMTLKAEHTEGESTERFIYADGFLYGYMKAAEGESKAKIERNVSEMQAMIISGELVHGTELEFSQLLSVECKIDNNRYVLTVKGLADEAFIETVLNEKIRDESYIQLIKQFYTYDNVNGYTATYVVDGNGRVVSYEVNSEYSFSSDSPEYGIVGSFDYKNSERMESFEDIPTSTAPEDANEYILGDDF